MRKLSFMAAALAAAALVTSPAQAANLIVNGGFEAPAIGGFFQNFASGSTAITGWTVDQLNAGENVDIVNGLFTPGGPSPAFEGAQFLDLVGFGTLGSIFQTFSTVAGQSYVLNFAYSHNLFGGDPSADAVVGVADGGPLGSAIFQTVFSHNSGTSTNLDWRQFSFGFVAAGTQSSLVFLSGNGGANAGILLDDVSVNAVPEPAAWALMIVGFGLVGGAVRRRKPSVRVSFA